jgi:hypothetical protein
MTYPIDIAAFLSRGSLDQTLRSLAEEIQLTSDAESDSWITDELKGYGADQALPSYRVVRASLKGTIQSASWVQYGQALSTEPRSRPLGGNFRTCRLTQSVSELERYTGGECGDLKIRVAPELCKDIGRGLPNGVWVQMAWVVVEPEEIRCALAAIKARLLSLSVERGIRRAGSARRRVAHVQGGSLPH